MQLFSYAMDIVFPGVLQQVLMDMFALDSEEVARPFFILCTHYTKFDVCCQAQHVMYTYIEVQSSDEVNSGLQCTVIATVLL